MKKLLLLIAVLFITNNIFSQCISGNCDNGTGYIKYESGDSYEGYFKDGQLHDLGIYYSKNKTTIWGQIKDAKYNGFGKIYWANGASYVGYLKNGKQGGLGILFDPKGSLYSAGVWEQGKLVKAVNAEDTNNIENCMGNCKDGYGLLELSNGRILQGLFINEKLVFGAIQTKEYVYYGDIKNNNAHGVGLIEYIDEKKHLGYFKNDKKQGAGIYTSGITLKKYGIWEEDVYKGLLEYSFNPKHFCNELKDLCNMTSKEIHTMQIQKRGEYRNLWRHKFLHRFNIFSNNDISANDVVIIDLTNTKGVTLDVVLKLLETSCTSINKIENQIYNFKDVKIDIINEKDALMLRLSYTKKE